MVVHTQKYKLAHILVTLINSTKLTNIRYLFLCCFQAIADTPSFIFLWVGDGLGLEQGRLCLKKVLLGPSEAVFWVIAC